MISFIFICAYTHVHTYTYIINSFFFCEGKYTYSDSVLIDLKKKEMLFWKRVLLILNSCYNCTNIFISVDNTERSCVLGFLTLFLSLLSFQSLIFLIKQFPLAQGCSKTLSAF